ncbi:MAG: leucine-rich repeat domain-containing protein [Actinobacteria bacterium]|nr:leucine-rich repeat domain-containing protein [Actinomycetota bacterium]
MASITIPPTVITIGAGAFSGTKISSILIPNSVTNIGTGAFSGTLITSAEIPNHITTIDFLSGTRLTHITIPSSVTRIENGAFWYCQSLTTVNIPNSVTQIGDYAFYGCTSLNQIFIGDKVESIGYEAFFGCTNLTSVTFGKALATVGNRAFLGCDKLKKLTFLGNAPSPQSTQGMPPWQPPNYGTITVYYFAGASGWGPTFADLTTVQLINPSVQSLVFNVNGNAQLSWSAMQGFVYEIQSTDSLDNPFVTRSTRTATNTLETWNEPDSSIPSKRFYRVIMTLP